MIQFEFAYSEKYIQEQWILTGKTPSKTDRIDVDEVTLTPEQRAVIAPHLRLVKQRFFNRAEIDLAIYKPQFDFSGSLNRDLMRFDARPSLEEILTLLPGIAAQYSNALSEARQAEEAKKAERAAEEERKRAQLAEQRIENEKRNTEAEAAKQQRLAERAAWIATHGSERLRKCQERGYDCARLYMVERAAVEYPGFVLDYNDSAAWDSRKGPSLAALKREEELAALYPEHEIKIVWLTCPASNAPDSDEDTYGFEPHEAIALRPPRRVDYLDHHGICWLVQDL